MFKPLNAQMRVVFNVAAFGVTAGLTWFFHAKGVIGGTFSWPATLTWLAFVGFLVISLRLFVQQAETPNELLRSFYRGR